MKLKICGMKHNTAEVAQLQPDYLGFIFYGDSPRNFDGSIPELAEGIKKVGVFVNAPIEFVLDKINKYGFEILQLHGEETPEYCEKLRKQILDETEIWKVFRIRDTFDFKELEAYEPVVNKFLFDTKGKTQGGTGHTFDWSVLKQYSSAVPFILSGGIGLEELAEVKEMQKTVLPLYAIDVNSKFEVEPGLKDLKKIEELKKELF